MARKKAAVLGATGMMGLKFVQLLANNPWFEVSALAASDKGHNLVRGGAGCPSSTPNSYWLRSISGD